MKNHYLSILKDSDARIARSRNLQFLDDESSEYYGGFYDGEGLIEAKFAIYRITTMIAGYFCKDSSFYRNPAVGERILLGLSFVKRTQRENGFFDLNNCNFYSGPDTAFCLKRIIPIFKYIKLHEMNDELGATIYKQLEDILIKGADAMVNGGFHTPNHRWAIASVLYSCSRLFNDEKYIAAASKYLAEGIDCNSDGEYAERSAGNYNRINNDAMITLYESTGDKKYLEPVKRNLDMMLTYIEPDGSIFTNNSTRQDRGNKIYLKDYYLEYLYMGVRCNIPEYLSTANYIMEIVREKGLTHMDCLAPLMLYPEFVEVEHEGSAIPVSYRKHYAESNIVRAREGSYSYSIINKCSTFLYFQSGALTMGMKIGASFCEHRAFVSQTLDEGVDGYRLKQTMEGWYYLPFGEPQDTTDWWKMQNDKRKKLLGPNMNFDIIVTPVEGGLDLNIKVDGIDRAPLRLELSFDCNSRVESDSFCVEGIGGGSIVAKKGIITVSKGKDAIEVGPAFGTHCFTAGKFGSENRNKNCFTVYLTDHTCFEHDLHIRSKASRF